MSKDPKPSSEASTIELIARANEAQHESLIAVLEPQGFERFWEEERRLRAYMPMTAWKESLREQVEERLRALGVDGPIIIQPVTEKNWNAVWEERLVPVTAGPFLVKPTRTEAPDDHEARFVLEIDPKMSFGTGHHESTRLALRLLATTNRDGARVLDAGTGTAVLAIAAVRLGAASVLAFDTDEKVLENANENIERNEVADQVDVRAGTLGEVIPEQGFDLILANINRNALSEMLPVFREKLNPGGQIILAGLLLSDRTPLLKRAAACGLSKDEEQTENEWWAVQLIEKAEGGKEVNDEAFERPSKTG